MSEQKRPHIEPNRATGRAKRARTVPADPKRLFPEPYKRYPTSVPPITDHKKVPAGWNAEDDDIDERDVEKWVQRCHDRIQDGIMPQWWEKKLEVYQEIKKTIDSAKDSEKKSGMILEAVMRVKHLELIEQYLETEGDPFSQLVNVTALIKGYRDGTLTWEDGRVSYWSDGKCMHGPVAFDMTFDDAKKYNQLCEGKSFWVEGLNGPGAVPMLAYNTPAWKSKGRPKRMLLHQHEIDFYFRVPGAGSQVSNVDYGHQASHRKFLDDTGSSMPIVFQDDVERIISYAGGSKPPFLCYIHSTNADRGTTVNPTCLIEYNVRSTLPNHGWMRPPNDWVSVQTIMKPHYFNPAVDYRLSGLWMRRVLYTATAPDNLGLIYLAESFAALRDSLPQADVRNAVPQPAYGPSDPESVNTAPTIYVRRLMNVQP